MASTVTTTATATVTQDTAGLETKEEEEADAAVTSKQYLAVTERAALLYPKFIASLYHGLESEGTLLTAVSDDYVMKRTALSTTKDLVPLKKLRQNQWEWDGPWALDGPRKEILKDSHVTVLEHDVDTALVLEELAGRFNPGVGYLSHDIYNGRHMVEHVISVSCYVYNKKI